MLLAAIAGGVLWGGWKSWDVWRFRRAMAEIGVEFEDGRYGAAARKLIALLAQRPNLDEALYLLGACEMARERIESADQTWARIPPRSRLAPRAILGRMRLRAERGRLAEAEQIIRDALDDPRIDGSTLPIALGPVYFQQGRLDEALRSIEARWDFLNQASEGATEPAINLVRGHIEHRRSPIPIEVIRSDLEPAARLNPHDDRVWLGKANLAIRVGSYEEAARWLDACLLRRPEDVPVWRARLNWAVATNRVTEAQEAMKHLPAGASTPAQVHRLASWLAARRGDLASERHALEGLVAADPIDSGAFDRLTELAVREGPPARVTELRRQKAEIDRLEARYQKLYQRNQPRRDAVEMAHLAEQLGHQFEARAWLTIAIASAPNREDLRRDLDSLNRRARTIDEPGRTLADVLVAVLDVAAGSSPSAATTSATRDESRAPIPLPVNPERTERRGAPE